MPQFPPTELEIAWKISYAILAVVAVLVVILLIVYFTRRRR
ncbi:MAG: hypothetical protein ACK4G3_01090 [bacterium]